MIGVAVLVPGPKGTDPRIPPPAGTMFLANPAEGALQRAFAAIGMKVTFINWYAREDGIPELVVGSKPNP